MNVTALIGLIAGLIDLAAYGSYMFAIFRKGTRPERASWLVWTVLGALITASYWRAGAEETVWLAVAETIGPGVIAVLSIRYGVGGWTWIDRFVLAGATISLTGWWLTGSPVVALLLLLATDFIGSVPTIQKAYRDPKSEDKRSWLMWITASVASAVIVMPGIVPGATFTELSFPLLATVVNTAIVIALVRHAIRAARAIPIRHPL